MKSMTKQSMVLVCMFVCLIVLTQGVYAAEKEKGVGVFPVCYFISAGNVSGPTFDVNLLVNNKDHDLTGYGTLTGQGHKPRYELKLEGDFGWVGSKRVVDIVGYQNLYSQKGVKKIMFARLYMIISEDWKSAEAGFRYMDENGDWKEVKNTRVNPEQCFK